MRLGLVPNSAWSKKKLPPGFAIVDPGASQDLIGLQAYEKLREELAKKGLQPVKLPGQPPPALGIGAKAKRLFCALAPCFLGSFQAW